MRRADVKKSSRGRRAVSKNVWKMGNRRAAAATPVASCTGVSTSTAQLSIAGTAVTTGTTSSTCTAGMAGTAAVSSRRQMRAPSRMRMDDCVSVATLGSFGSASWVAGHFLEDESGRSGGEDGHASETDGAAGESCRIYHGCKQCSNDFKSRSALQTHMEEAHAGGSTAAFGCPHCGKAFTRRSEMGRHVGVRWFAIILIAVYVSQFISKPVRWLRHCFSGGAWKMQKKLTSHVYGLMQNQHDNRTSFLHCERCAFKHEDAECFQRHVAEQHKRCKYCQNEFKQLKKHENSCHLKPG